MDSLHAPWRIEYILSPKSAATEGLFTQIAQSNDDEANLVIARDRTCYALLNRYPYTGGHLMIVPYKQVRDMNGLTDEEITDMMKLTRRCQNALTRLMKPDGFNIGINQGKLLAVDLATQNLAWTFETDASRQNGPPLTMPDGSPNYQVAFGDNFYDSMVTGVSRMMSLGAILSSPVVVNNVIYVGSTDGFLYALM